MLFQPQKSHIYIQQIYLYRYFKFLKAHTNCYSQNNFFHEEWLTRNMY